MANIKTTISNWTKKQNDDIKKEKDKKKEKKASLGSNIIEPTVQMIRDVMDFWLLGADPGGPKKIEMNASEIRKKVKNSQGFKLTIDQVNDIILIAMNVVEYKADPVNWELSEDGKTLIWIGTTPEGV